MTLAHFWHQTSDLVRKRYPEKSTFSKAVIYNTVFNRSCSTHATGQMSDANFSVDDLMVSIYSTFILRNRNLNWKQEKSPSRGDTKKDFQTCLSRSEKHTSFCCSYVLNISLHDTDERLYSKTSLYRPILGSAFGWSI